MNDEKSLLRLRIILGICFVTTFTLSLVIHADDLATGDPWVAPARQAKKKNPVPADAESIATGKSIYVIQCLKCHGDTGKGDGPSAKDLNPQPKNLSDPDVAGQTDGALYWKITTGRAPMPGFENLVSDNDRWNVVNYLRVIAPPPATQPAK